MFKRILFILLFGISLMSGAQEASNPDPLDIAKKMQSILSSDSVHAIIGAKTADASGNGVSIVVEYFGLKNDKGELMSLASFLQPSSIKGTRFLVLQRFELNDDQWVYLPATKQVTRIATSSKQQEFMGTDFTFEDLGSRDVKKFNYKLLGTEVVDGYECWVIETVAKEGVDWIYSRIIDWIAKDYNIPLLTEFYEKETGALLKKNSIDDVKVIQGYPTIMGTHMRNVQTGHSTSIKIAKIEYDVEIPVRMFSSGYLKSGKF